MSRSYKKGYGHICSSYGDKWCRFQYHKSLRAKENRILKECEKAYRSCRLFEPYEKCCGLNGEVCDIDVDAYLELDDPHDKTIYDNNLINPEEILCTTYSKRMNKCIGCYYSENCWKNGEFFDVWETNPDEQFCNNNIDYSVRYSDKWIWASDGGAYFRENISSLRKDFVIEAFGDIAIWEKYCKNKEKQADHDWSLISFLFHRGIIPLNFKTKDELLNWFLENENQIVIKWYKVLNKK